LALLNKKTINVSIVALVIGLFLGHLYTKTQFKPLLSPHSAHPSVSVTDAVAVVLPTVGSTVTGIVTFRQLDSGAVLVKATVSGLKPLSKHGFHIHEFGDLRTPDGTGAGSHYNPEGNPHDLPPARHRHAGSYGNLLADEAGVAHLELEDTTISVDGPFNPILGRSVVVHRDEDDGSQPLGNAGPRIGVGVIGVADPR